VNARRPAYSAAFAPEAIQPLPRSGVFDTMTAEDAWGDSTGSGVKVAVIDNGIDVCGLSLGSTRQDCYAALHDLADLAYDRNMILVTAANTMPVPGFSSVFTSVISVTAHDVPGPYRYVYDPEPPVEFGAHGIDVHVAWHDGGYLTTTGGSFAAPHIAGLMAKLLGKHPDLTAFQVKSVVRAVAANALPEGATAAGGASAATD